MWSGANDGNSRSSFGDDVDVVDDDDKENSHLTSASAMNRQRPSNLESLDGTGVQKSTTTTPQMVESLLDFDLTPTAYSKELPYVSEAELDALMDNFDAGAGGNMTSTTSTSSVRLDNDSKLIDVDVTDSDLDALLLTSSEDNGDVLMDSGHSSGGEASSLLGSIDDIPSASVEIPSISDSTSFSEDIPNLQQLPADAGGATVAAAAAVTNGNRLLSAQNVSRQQPQSHNCPPSGARPKVRPGSLGIITSSVALPGNTLNSGNTDSQIDNNNDDDSPISRSSTVAGAGALDDVTPTNHLPSASVGGFSVQDPSTSEFLSFSSSLIADNDIDNHHRSSAATSSSSRDVVAIDDDELLLSSSSSSSERNHHNGTLDISGTIVIHDINQSLSNSVARHDITPPTIITTTSSSSSSSSCLTANASPHLLSSSPLSSFTTQSYPNITSSICNNAIDDLHSPTLHDGGEDDEEESAQKLSSLSSSAMKTFPIGCNSFSTIKTDDRNWSNPPGEAAADDDDRLSSSLASSCTRNLESPPSSMGSLSSIPFPARTSSAASAIFDDDERAVTPDTPDDIDDELDLSSSSIRHLTSPPTPFVKGTSFEDEESLRRGSNVSGDTLLATPTTPLHALLLVDEAPSLEPAPIDSIEDKACREKMFLPPGPSENATLDSLSSENPYSKPEMGALATDDVIMGDAEDASKETAGATENCTKEVAISVTDDENASIMEVVAASSSDFVAADSLRRPPDAAASGGPSVKRPSSLDLPSRPAFAFKPQKRHHRGVDDPSPSLDSVDGVIDKPEAGGGGGGDDKINAHDDSFTAATPDDQLNDAAAASDVNSAATPDAALLAVALASIPPEYRDYGAAAPTWVPDSAAPVCTKCQLKFTFTRRRHHCRGCGNVFCAECWGKKAKLRYMDKEGRVCNDCHPILMRIHELLVEHNALPVNNVKKSSSLDDLDDNAVKANATTTTTTTSTTTPVGGATVDPAGAFVLPAAPVGVLRKGSSSKKGEPKTVIFFDGIRPGGDLTDSSSSSSSVAPPGARSGGLKQNNNNKSHQQQQPQQQNNNYGVLVGSSAGIPVPTNLDADVAHDPEKVMTVIKDETAAPVIFAINRNLTVSVKIVQLSCCVNKTAWTFTSNGMCTVGQDEIVIVLACLKDIYDNKDNNDNAGDQQGSSSSSSITETAVPRDILCHFNTVYEEAQRGNYVSDLGHTIFNQSFLGSRDHGGFLYVRPTFQCLKKIPLPKEPNFIFGVLLQKWETPWAKVFPLRLMLRLGAHEKYYPCPIVGERYRKPLYAEIGHTIINLLADFRNYQYTLPQIKGVLVHMEDKKTVVRLPSNRYQEVMRVVNSANEHVMAFGANFSDAEADSHLVCIQNDEGNYATQAINIQNRPRKITGASFVVFNGALKSTSGLKAKSSIVEDGLMVQVPAEVLAQLKQNLKNMTSFEIVCGSVDHSSNNNSPSSSTPSSTSGNATLTAEETVLVEWGPEDKKDNVGAVSPIDNRSFQGTPSIKVQAGRDFHAGNGLALRWTEVFLIQVGPAPSSSSSSDDDTSAVSKRVSFNILDDQPDITRVSDLLARATAHALLPHLAALGDEGKTKVGLRVTLGSEMVGYEVGSNGQPLGPVFMVDMDNELVPVIHRIGPTGGVTSPSLGLAGSPLVLELIFFVVR